MSHGPGGEGMVRALFLGGGQEGPPADIAALPDGSPPEAVEFAAVFPIMAARQSGHAAYASPGQVYVLAPHQHAPRPPAAPWRYIYTGDRPRPGLPAEGTS